MSGRINFVVIITYEDAINEYKGIYGPVTRKQEEILMESVDTDSDDGKQVRACSILRMYDGDEEYQEESEDYQEVKEHIFREDQIIKLTAENWPRYPVMTVAFGNWC